MATSLFNVFMRPIVIQRPSGGAWVNGRWVEDPSGFLLIDALASFQPVSGDEIQLVPEGRREREVFKLYTSTKIFSIADQDPNQNTDRIFVDNKLYEVIQVWPWIINPFFSQVEHYKALCVGLDELQ